MAATLEQRTPVAQANPTTAPGRGWVRRLFAYCRHYPAITTLAIVGSCALALNAVTPLLTKAVIDDIDSRDSGSTSWAIIGLVAVAFGLFGTTFLRR
ncbi:MAG: hypothetical protein ACR2P2_08805, partial [Nakamurella sp.]